tara:strand:- start:85 stop:336 length:252 start_codon:yes stop_codon:yes gene_type:complete
MDICIKNINDEKWREFKAESARHGLKMGELFNKMVDEHKEHCHKTNWDEILHGEKPLKGMIENVDFKKVRKEFRENFKLREFS